MPRAAVFTPFFVDRDAVCNDVLHSTRLLREAGWDAHVFAIGSESTREKARPLGDLRGFLRDPEDLLYFHLSTGRRDVLEAITGLPGRKVLKYHNITPPELFSLWSDDLAEANRIGLRELASFAALGWERVLGDSAFNLAQVSPLLKPGTPCSVVPPFHDTDELLALRPAGASKEATPRLLTVGRLVQSKGHAFLLRVMRYLVHELGVAARLDIVGKPDHRLLAYQRMLELMVREFALENHVAFHGETSAADLARYYAHASIFVSGSEHEGFCVPIVESFAFGLPVLALATTAVPETIGDAGIAWEERDPRLFALTIERLLRSPDERRWLGEKGRARYEEHFAPTRIASRLRRELGLQAAETAPA